MKINLPKSLIITIALSLSIIISCQDIIEKDISQEEIKLILPQAQYTTKDSVITFWWEPVEGTTAYRLQIVSPDFDHPQKLWKDSVLLKNQAEFIFPEGQYGWRVQGLNGSYQTAFSIRKLEITTASQ